MKNVCLVLISAALLVPVAHATTLDFSFSGGGASGSGTLTLTPSGTVGVDEVTGITGTFTGPGYFANGDPSATPELTGAITGLYPVINSYDAASPSSTPTGSTFDNLLYISAPAAKCGLFSTTAPSLDDCGIEFVGAGFEVNLYGDPVRSGYQIAYAPINSTYGATDNPNFLDVTFTTFIPVAVSETPEPSSLVLLGTGALGLAGALRRRVSGIAGSR